MLSRLSFGELPEKHHTALRDDRGALRYEECLTRDGFEGPYTLMYHRDKPQGLRPGGIVRGSPPPKGQLPTTLARRHYRALALKPAGATPLSARVPLLFNDDLCVSLAQPSVSDEAYTANGDGDELLFIYEGAGTVRSVLGDLRFEKNDYVFLPRALIHRLLVEGTGPQRWLSIELRKGVDLPRQ